MAAIATNVRRLPGPIQALIASLVFVALALLILRVALDPNEERMRASAEAARPQREAVQVRTRAPTDASTTTESSAATDAAAESDLPGVGDTLVSTDDLSVTLLAVEDLSELPQLVGGPVDPRRDYFRIVTIEFENNSSDPTTVQNTNIWLVKDDGSRVVIDSNSLDRLISAPPLAFDSRPLFLAESVPVDKSIVVSVSFDVRESDTITKLDVEGLLFAMPAVNLDAGAAAVAEAEAETEATATAEAEATPEANVRDTRAGSSLDTAVNRGRARIEAEEQVAESRTGLPTVGDALLGDDGLEVTLVSVQRFEELTQVHGSPFRPKNGLFQIVTITFNNTNDSGNIVVSKANIVMIEPDGNEIPVNSPGINALIGMATTATEGRPLFLVESVPNGKTATVAVVFDVDPGLLDLQIDIEGFIFEVPNP
ncbi:MAG: hypothetical protein OXG33_13945 [Chloroflexi bacterium]|nr:hypothetical protein [Chloroflexota bacterium]